MKINNETRNKNQYKRSLIPTHTSSSCEKIIVKVKMKVLENIACSNTYIIIRKKVIVEVKIKICIKDMNESICVNLEFQYIHVLSER